MTEEIPLMNIHVNDKNMASSEQIITLEQGFAHSGNFGWFQILSTFILAITMMTSGLLIFNLPYLNKEPKYLCLD